MITARSWQESEHRIESASWRPLPGELSGGWTDRCWRLANRRLVALQRRKSQKIVAAPPHSLSLVSEFTDPACRGFLGRRWLGLLFASKRNLLLTLPGHVRVVRLQTSSQSHEASQEAMERSSVFQPHLTYHRQDRVCEKHRRDRLTHRRREGSCQEHAVIFGLGGGSCGKSERYVVCRRWKRDDRARSTWRSRCRNRARPSQNRCVWVWMCSVKNGMKYKMRGRREGLKCRSAARLDDGTGVGGNSWPDVGALLGNGASDGRTLHLTLGVDNDTGVVLEVEEDTVTTPPGLALADDDSGHDCGMRGALEVEGSVLSPGVLQTETARRVSRPFGVVLHRHHHHRLSSSSLDSTGFLESTDLEESAAYQVKRVQATPSWCPSSCYQITPSNDQM